MAGLWRISAWSIASKWDKYHAIMGIVIEENASGERPSTSRQAICVPIPRRNGRIRRIGNSAGRPSHGRRGAPRKPGIRPFHRHDSWLCRDGVYGNGNRPQPPIDGGALRATRRRLQARRQRTEPTASSQECRPHRTPPAIRHKAAPQSSCDLIKLAEPLPARIHPARLAKETQTVAVGDTLIIAGYGVTVRGDGQTGGTARTATLVVTGQPG